MPNIKGQHRKMFRKPGLARQAIGILASSPELAQEVQRVRLNPYNHSQCKTLIRAALQS